MRRWASFSSALVTLAAAVSAVPARVYLTQDRALEEAFGAGAKVERQAVFLTEAQVLRARELAGPGVAVESALVARYVGSRDGQPLGTAYFDTHRVRALQETLMILIAPDGTVSRVEVLAFGEPEEYLPRPSWRAQFKGKALDRDLSLSGGIHGITGATLTARAVTEATRRTLAIHRALQETR